MISRQSSLLTALTFFRIVLMKYFVNDLFTSIANVMRASGCEIPEWMLQMKNPNKCVFELFI